MYIDLKQLNFHACHLKIYGIMYQPSLFWFNRAWRAEPCREWGGEKGEEGTAGGVSKAYAMLE